MAAAVEIFEGIVEAGSLVVEDQSLAEVFEEVIAGQTQEIRAASLAITESQPVAAEFESKSLNVFKQALESINASAAASLEEFSLEETIAELEAEEAAAAATEEKLAEIKRIDEAYDELFADDPSEFKEPGDMSQVHRFLEAAEYESKYITIDESRLPDWNSHMIQRSLEALSSGQDALSNFVLTDIEGEALIEEAKVNRTFWDVISESWSNMAQSGETVLTRMVDGMLDLISEHQVAAMTALRSTFWRYALLAGRAAILAASTAGASIGVLEVLDNTKVPNPLGGPKINLTTFFDETYQGIWKRIIRSFHRSGGIIGRIGGGSRYGSGDGAGGDDNPELAPGESFSGMGRFRMREAIAALWGHISDNVNQGLQRAENGSEESGIYAELRSLAVALLDQGDALIADDGEGIREYDEALMRISTAIQKLSWATHHILTELSRVTTEAQARRFINLDVADQIESNWSHGYHLSGTELLEHCITVSNLEDLFPDDLAAPYDALARDTGDVDEPEGPDTITMSDDRVRAILHEIASDTLQSVTVAGITVMDLEGFQLQDHELYLIFETIAELYFGGFKSNAIQKAARVIQRLDPTGMAALIGGASMITAGSVQKLLNRGIFNTLLQHIYSLIPAPSSSAGSRAFLSVDESTNSVAELVPPIESFGSSAERGTSGGGGGGGSGGRTLLADGDDADDGDVKDSVTTDTGVQIDLTEKKREAREKREAAEIAALDTGRGQFRPDLNATFNQARDLKFFQTQEWEDYENTEFAKFSFVPDGSGVHDWNAEYGENVLHNGNLEEERIRYAPAIPRVHMVDDYEPTGTNLVLPRTFQDTYNVEKYLRPTLRRAANIFADPNLGPIRHIPTVPGDGISRWWNGNQPTAYEDVPISIPTIEYKDGPKYDSVEDPLATGGKIRLSANDHVGSIQAYRNLRHRSYKK